MHPNGDKKNFVFIHLKNINFVLDLFSILLLFCRILQQHIIFQNRDTLEQKRKYCKILKIKNEKKKMREKSEKKPLALKHLILNMIYCYFGLNATPKM